VKDLKYLNATIDEGLRMFATNAFGLPRVVPDGMSVAVEGHTFYEGVSPFGSLLYVLYSSIYSFRLTIILILADGTVLPCLYHTT